MQGVIQGEGKGGYPPYLQFPLPFLLTELAILHTILIAGNFTYYKGIEITVDLFFSKILFYFPPLLQTPV